MYDLFNIMLFNYTYDFEYITFRLFGYYLDVLDNINFSNSIIVFLFYILKF